MCVYILMNIELLFLWGSCNLIKEKKIFFLILLGKNNEKNLANKHII